MFDTKPKALYFYMVTIIDSNGEETIQGNIFSKLGDTVIYKNSPPKYQYRESSKPTTNYLFLFDEISEEYSYIMLGITNIFTETDSRYPNYPYRLRWFNKGKLVDNTFFWYSQAEKIDRYDNIISNDYGKSDYQFNYKDSSQAYKYYWVALL